MQPLTAEQLSRNAAQGFPPVPSPGTVASPAGPVGLLCCWTLQTPALKGSLALLWANPAQWEGAPSSQAALV